MIVECLCVHFVPQDITCNKQFSYFYLFYKFIFSTTYYFYEIFISQCIVFSFENLFFKLQ